MQIDAIHEREDEKFVRAASDSEECAAYLQRLSKSRRTFYKIGMGQSILVLILFTFKFFEETFLNRHPSYTLLIFLASLEALYMAFYFYFDLQIKFLKATMSDKS